MKILIINGPNLNILGKRQPEIYGYQDFNGFLEQLKKRFSHIEIDYYQSNHEGALIDRIQQADGQYEGIVLNAGAYAHTSIAITDAIQAVSCGVVEVHISNIYAREAFRHTSYLAPYCKGVITGFGLMGYQLAIDSFINE